MKDTLDIFIKLNNETLAQIFVEYPYDNKKIRCHIEASKELTDQQLLLAYRVLKDLVQMKKILPKNLQDDHQIDFLTIRYEK